MSAPSPQWERPNWLPEFEVIEWPRLRELQVAHTKLLEEQQRAGSALGAVKARFAAEDQRALDRERQVARSGKAPPTGTDGLTPPLRRQAQLEVAIEDYATAREALLAHVELEVRESLDRQPAVEDELRAAARREAGATGGITPDRTALERDIAASQQWFLTTLGVDGENVKNEIAAARGIEVFV